MRETISNEGMTVRPRYSSIVGNLGFANTLYECAPVGSRGSGDGPPAGRRPLLARCAPNTGNAGLDAGNLVDCFSFASDTGPSWVAARTARCDPVQTWARTATQAEARPSLRATTQRLGGDGPGAMAVGRPDCGGHKHCSLDSLALARGIMSDCSARILSMALPK